MEKCFEINSHIILFVMDDKEDDIVMHEDEKVKDIVLYEVVDEIIKDIFAHHVLCGLAAFCIKISSTICIKLSSVSFLQLTVVLLPSLKMS